MEWIEKKTLHQLHAHRVQRINENKTDINVKQRTVKPTVFFLFSLWPPLAGELSLRLYM